MHLFEIGLTDHLEGPSDRPSTEVFEEVAELVRLADRLGVATPGSPSITLMRTWASADALALRAAPGGPDANIRLGTAITCLNLHHPLDVAEQVAVADADRRPDGGGFRQRQHARGVSLFGVARPTSRAGTPVSRRRWGSSDRSGAA